MNTTQPLSGTENPQIFVNILELNSGAGGNVVKFRQRDELHRLVMSGFGKLPERQQHEPSGILWRFDIRNGKPMLYVQSVHPFFPNQIRSDVACVRSGEISSRIDSLAQGDTFSFNLVANPTTVKRTKNTDGEWGNMRKIPVGVAETPDWICRKGIDSGFSVQRESLVVSNPEVDTIGLKKNSAKLNVVRFAGSATATNTDLLKHAVATGIGRGKAYGCGLLVVGRIEHEQNV